MMRRQAQMISMWRLLAFGLVVFVQYFGQVMEATHGQIKVMKEENEVMKIRPPIGPPPYWNCETRGWNTALEDWIQLLNEFILLNFIFPIFSLLIMNFVAIVLFLVIVHDTRFITLTEGTTSFDIVSGGRIYLFDNSCIQLVRLVVSDSYCSFRGDCLYV
ncbi:unnamed protein product [Cuscuta epithymum]|uniref:Uncharacterized protein n=1 Tax=Cuscuta epithymum TaxID=186058 RepID=A0AAV0CD95_9ASTE|nr:unnamed protein product [Cuscuta epithymum]